MALTPTKYLDFVHAEKRISVAQNLRIQQRTAAIHLLCDGHSPQEVATTFGVLVKTVKDWQTRYDNDGPDGLHDRARSGRPKKAAGHYTTTLEAILAELPQGATVSGWTVPLLCTVMEQRTGIRLSHTRMRNLLHHLGYRYQPARSFLDATIPPLPDNVSDLKAWLEIVEKLRVTLPTNTPWFVQTWVKIASENDLCATERS